MMESHVDKCTAVPNPLGPTDEKGKRIRDGANGHADGRQAPLTGKEWTLAQEILPSLASL